MASRRVFKVEGVIILQGWLKTRFLLFLASDDLGGRIWGHLISRSLIKFRLLSMPRKMMKHQTLKKPNPTKFDKIKIICTYSQQLCLLSVFNWKLVHNWYFIAVLLQTLESKPIAEWIGHYCSKSLWKLLLDFHDKKLPKIFLPWWIRRTDSWCLFLSRNQT